MDKSVSRSFYLFGILITVIGAFLLAYGLSGSVVQPLGTLALHVAHPFWMRLGVIVVAIGSLLMLVGWMGALARTAQLGRWIWFVSLIIFPGIGLLLYVFFGPRTPSRRAQQPVTMPPPTPSYGD